ncbi:chaperone NapD [Rivibacter subsaxonicus]|uniref:Chaperone NapD n=1 Tax=Rivibacter subsaxonicus TaxID=457575 RepID=A0A4Q7VB49_9BURK|nr:chaperone NapD [Rivibacter subsaxonicus]RZT93845.1 periplasmic nitrate reductase chaperone NapD [Rivibacter subsaxonicus]
MRSTSHAPIEDFGELHITSLVLHALPRHLQRVSRAIAAVPGAELHATGPTGKLVVTLEAPSAKQIMARVAELQGIDGVISAVLVYQHAESLARMNEEIPDGDDGTTDLH